jgi:hypothetical protein
MNGNILRRRMASIKEDKLLYPDAYMAVFTCNANTTYDMMYSNGVLGKTILDGVEVSSVKPTTSGKHILYFWLTKADRLKDYNWNGGPEYLRIPANPQHWHHAFVHNVGDLKQIDFLGTTPPQVDSDFGNHLPKIQKVRVPVGSRDAYVAALSKAGSGIKNKTNIIVETKDFSYNI